MTPVQLQMPPEIIEELALPYEGIRGADAIVIAIDSVGVAANLVTVIAFMPIARRFVTAVRRWRAGDPRDVVVLTIKGPGIDLVVPLPRNVDTGLLLRQLAPLFAGDPDAVDPEA